MLVHSFPQVKMAPLSMYMPKDALLQDLILYRSGAMYIMERTSETGDQ